MKIEVVTAWHNEEILAPYFFNHYDYVDKFYIIMGDDTTDQSRQLCEEHPKVEIVDYTFPGGLLDDLLKIEIINKVIRSKLDTDWFFVLDADEFIFSINHNHIKNTLDNSSTGFNLHKVQLFNVYRHKDDKDLNPYLPPVPQRLHGIADPRDKKNKRYNKPCVAKLETDISYGVGAHTYKANNKIRPTFGKLAGAHWVMADKTIALDRRIKGRRDRLSNINLNKHFGAHNMKVTEEEILQELEAHLDDPIIDFRLIQ